MSNVTFIALGRLFLLFGLASEPPEEGQPAPSTTRRVALVVIGIGLLAAAAYLEITGEGVSA